MASLFQKFKMPLIILGILVVSFVLFKLFFNSAPSSDVLTAQTSNAAVGQTFVTQLRQLNQIKLNASLFNDPLFQSLSDFSQPLPEIPIGRQNPFAPISGLDASAEYSLPSTNINAPQFNSVTPATTSAATASSSKSVKANSTSTK